MVGDRAGRRKRIPVLAGARAPARGTSPPCRTAAPCNGASGSRLRRLSTNLKPGLVFEDGCGRRKRRDARLASLNSGVPG